MSAFGQSLENSLEYERMRAVRMLLAFLRRSHRFGILHFRRDDGGVSIGCALHDGFEVETVWGEERDAVGLVAAHLSTDHPADYLVEEPKS